MLSFSWKITYFIILSGAFIMLALVGASYQNASGVFYSLIYFLVLFVVLFGLFVGKRFSRPLKRIVKAANELADGNVKSRAHVGGFDEMGQLAASLNKIAQAMEKTHQEKETLKHSVAMKVSSIVRPLHDTIEALEQKAKNRTMEFHKANEVAEKMQIDLLLKEAELVDLKGQMAKLMVRKSKKIITEEV